MPLIFESGNDWIQKIGHCRFLLKKDFPLQPSGFASFAKLSLT